MKSIYIWVNIYYIWEEKMMARPIGNTPELVGDEANEFIERMFQPPTEKRKKMRKEMLKQRRVHL